MTAPQASSRLEMLQARFQQKQLQEKEQKLLQLYDQQQQRAYQVVQRGSAGSNSSNHSSTTIKTSTTTTSTSQGGKVRQMFDERRQTSVKGIDRSYPLEPLENKLQIRTKQTNTNVATQKNGNLNRQSVSMRRVARADVNSNVNNGKPVVSYHEEITRESFEPPTHHLNDEDEFGVVENRVATFANGHYRHDADNEEEIALDQETIERNRMMAKIHLMGFDETLKHRVRNDLESEEFPEYLMMDVSDKLPKKNATKKLTQAEARLQRFKNANAKRSDMPKHSTSNNKQSKETVSTRSNFRRSEITGTSSTSAKSGSSRSSVRNRTILENAENPLLVAKTRATNEISKKQRKSLDIETVSQRDPLRDLFKNATKTQINWMISPRNNEFKSVTSDGRIFVRRSSSPQFFCRETERSATTMSIDQKSDTSEPFFYRDILTKRNKSPPFYLSESEQSYRINKSKSLYDKEILSKQMSPRYLRPESRQSKSTLSTESPDWNKEILIKQNTTPQYFDKKTETSLDRKTTKSPELDEEEMLNRSNKPQFFCKESERSATTMSLSRENSESKLYETISGKRITSPQSISEKSKQSATIMTKSRSNSTDSTKRTLKQRNYDSDVFYKQSVSSSPLTNRKISYTRDRYTPSRLKREVKRDLNKSNTSRLVTETRRSPNISEISATSASSIVSLKYGLEFDNIFQSVKPVRKSIKSQNGKIRRLPLKRNNINTPRDNLSKIRYKTLSPSREAKSPSIGNRRKTTFETPRKSITPTEVDMEIQEITMTDHRIEYDKMRKTPTPISKRQINEIYTKSPSNKIKSKPFFTYSVSKTRRQRASILESNVLKSKASSFEENKKSKDQNEESAISLSKLGCSSKSDNSQHIITYDPTRLYSSSSEKNKNKISEIQKQTWNQAIRNQSKERKSRQHENIRYPNQMRNQFMENKARSLKASSYDSRKKRTNFGDTVSPILSDSKKQIEETRTKFLQPRSLRSAQLVQDILKNKNLSVIANERYNQERSKNKNVAIDKIDAAIDVNYQAIVESTLNREIKDHRKITRPNSNDATTNKDVSFRVTTRESSTKSSTSKKIAFPTKVCGRQRCTKSNISPRSSLRKISEISRGADVSKVLLPRRIVSQANQSSTPKFLTHTLEHRKRKNVSIATKLAESPNKMSVQHKIEDSEGNARKMSRTLTSREKNKFKKDFESINSVGSTLKRLDYKDAKFEQLTPISFRVSPEISLDTTNVQTKTCTKVPIASKESTVVHFHKGIDDMTFKSPLKFPISKDLKVKNVPHKSNRKILGKEMRSSKKLIKTGNLTENQQRSTRSSVCKRLFKSDSETDIQKERSNLSYVETRNKGYYSRSNLKSRNNGTVLKISSFKNFDHKVKKRSKKFEEISIFTIKPLRSIKDIRKSIDNEQSKLIITKESRPVIANRRSVSSESVDVKRLIPATDVVKNTFLKSDPVRLTKLTSCISRIMKSPSPDSAARKQLNTRGNPPASPSKSSDIALKRASANPKNQDAKPSRKSAKDADLIGNKATGAEAIDTTDGVVLQNDSLHESTTKTSDVFKQQTASNASDRPTSSISSNSSANSTQGQISNSKSKMTTRTKTSADNLVACNICGRRFARDRISYHEQICVKTTNKKRKKFDTTMFRVRGTELEPFVKKGLPKKQETKKSEVKSNWRRKHEDFINTIRSAKEYQAAVAKGINPADLPPPPPSDTSDYIQCPHCGRKFNKAAAERHISKCENMLHNKPMHMRAKLRR